MAHGPGLIYLFFIWYIFISFGNLPSPHPILSSNYSPLTHPTPLPPFFPGCERCPISSLQARASVLCQRGSLIRPCPPTASELTGRDHLPPACLFHEPTSFLPLDAHLTIWVRAWAPAKGAPFFQEPPNQDIKIVAGFCSLSLW